MVVYGRAYAHYYVPKSIPSSARSRTNNDERGAGWAGSCPAPRARLPGWQAGSSRPGRPHSEANGGQRVCPNMIFGRR